MRKRAGLARRTAYTRSCDRRRQLAAMLIVTHNLDIAATVPDNMGIPARLVTFGREVLLTSDEPVVAQFLGGRREGHRDVQEKDAATLAAEADAARRGPGHTAPGDPPLEPSPGLPPRRAVARRRERVMGMIDTLPPAARSAIRETYAKSSEAATLPMPAAGSGA
ncbi:ATP-binding cassette domain-containing protein OS=Streptomyces tendae OX=1932 GN=GUR47_10340 PE=4 SV=1 [Streptomyces tendae]